LYFADELADIAKKMARLGDGADHAPKIDWWDCLRELQHRFLKFRTRSYFTEVSNQIQGKDLFRFWYDRLGTRELFDRVAQTSAEVYQAAENDEMKQLSREQKRLANVATWGLGVTIALATMAAALTWADLFPDSVKSDLNLGGEPIWAPWGWLGLSVILASISWFAFIKAFPKLRRHSSPIKPKT